MNYMNPNIMNNYYNYMITSQKHHTPTSGNFPIGNNFFGNLECVNNQTGRVFYANPCGYWNNTPNQFNSGKILNNNKNLNGALFPIGYISDKIMINPNDSVVFGYTRVGEEFRNT